VSAVDWVIAAAVVLAIGLAAFFIVRRKKRGGSCCGTCSGCALSGNCGKSPEPEEKTADK
jgi:LPXTG-motif cell wall-anchored protein